MTKIKLQVASKGEVSSNGFGDLCVLNTPQSLFAGKYIAHGMLNELNENHKGVYCSIMSTSHIGAKLSRDIMPLVQKEGLSCEEFFKLVENPFIDSKAGQKDLGIIEVDLNCPVVGATEATSNGEF